MIDYADLAQSSLELIREAGTTATISRKSGGVFDSITSKYTTAQTVTTGTIDCVKLAYTHQGVRQLQSGNVIADNKFIQAFTQGKVKKLVIAASTCPFEPLAGDTVTGIEDSEWTVWGCNTLQPAEVPLIYSVAISRK